MVQLSNEQKEEIWEYVEDSASTVASTPGNPLFDESLAKYLGVLSEYNNWILVPRNQSSPLHLKICQILGFYRNTLRDQENIIQNLIHLLEKKQKRNDCNALLDALRQHPLELTQVDVVDGREEERSVNKKPRNRRMALIIGITYEPSLNEPNQHLPGCADDLMLMKEALESVGFIVTIHQDLELDEMKVLIKLFVKTLQADDEVLFYFSGHGCTMDGYQFLIPSKMFDKTQTQDSLDAKLFADSCYNIIHIHNLFIEKIRECHKIFILDCCRTRSFDRIMKKGSYEEDIQRYPNVQKKANNVIYLHATNDHNEASACPTESLFTKKLAPLIIQNKSIPEILNRLDQASKDENWSQKPIVEGTNLSFRF